MGCGSSKDAVATPERPPPPAKPSTANSVADPKSSVSGSGQQVAPAGPNEAAATSALSSPPKPAEPAPGPAATVAPIPPQPAAPASAPTPHRSDQASESAAALRIQAQERRRQAVKRVEDLKQKKKQEESAVKIQAQARRMAASKRVGEMKQSRGAASAASVSDATSVSDITPADVNSLSSPVEEIVSSEEQAAGTIPPLFHRGRKMNDGNYFMLSAVDADSGFEFRAYDPRSCRTLTTALSFEAAAALVPHDPALARDAVVLCEHLARRLMIDGSKLTFAPAPAALILPVSAPAKATLSKYAASKKMAGEYVIVSVEQPTGKPILVTAYNPRKAINRILHVTPELLTETLPESVATCGNFKTIAVGIVDRLSLVGDELALASVPLQHSVPLAVPAATHSGKGSAPPAAFHRAMRIAGSYSVVTMLTSGTALSINVWQVKPAVSLTLTVALSVIKRNLSRHAATVELVEQMSDGVSSGGMPSMELYAYLAERLQVHEGQLVVPGVSA